MRHFPRRGKSSGTGEPLSRRLRSRAGAWKLALRSLHLNRNTTPMHICIFGAGAVGSHFAVRLALAGHDVSCVMRGPHLASREGKRPDLARRRCQLQRQGEGVRQSGRSRPTGPCHQHAEGDRRCQSCNRPAAAAPRRHAGGVRAERDSLVVRYRANCRSSRRRPISPFSIPTAVYAPRFPKERIIGGVIFSSNEVVAPGVVANLSPERNMLLVGECDDRAKRTHRAAARRAQ